MELPNFEYVAKLSDGRFVKGVIPILTDNKVRTQKFGLKDLCL